MKFDYECLHCYLKQVQKVSKILEIEDDIKESVVREVLKQLSEADYDKTNPEIMYDTWGIITKIVGDKNPYKSIKEFYNNEMMKIYNVLKDSLNSSPKQYRLQKAILLAIEGNLIDFGANHYFDGEAMTKSLIEGPKHNLAINHTDELCKRIKKAKKLLYIGDNCGEIVLDKLMISVIKDENPNIKITFSVRSDSILNDITVDDADQVGMKEVAEVIDSGSGESGAVLHKCSQSFMQCYNEADVIIAKGQGNYESLNESDNDKLFFLFIAKCQKVADYLNIDLMDRLCCEASSVKILDSTKKK